MARSGSPRSLRVTARTPWRTSRAFRAARCSPVWRHQPSSAATTNSTAGTGPMPASMLEMKRWWPGTSTKATVSPVGRTVQAYPRSMVIPRRFSSAQRSGSMPVRARMRVDFPWSTWPAVAMTYMAGSHEVAGVQSGQCSCLVVGEADEVQAPAAALIHRVLQLLHLPPAAGDRRGLPGAGGEHHQTVEDVLVEPGGVGQGVVAALYRQAQPPEEMRVGAHDVGGVRDPERDVAGLVARGQPYDGVFDVGGHVGGGVPVHRCRGVPLVGGRLRVQFRGGVGPHEVPVNPLDAQGWA